jgi:hypothetical protein
MGKVNVPQEAFMVVIRINDEGFSFDYILNSSMFFQVSFEFDTHN